MKYEKTRTEVSYNKKIALLINNKKKVITLLHVIK